MYPPRPEPSLKERQESGRLVMGVFAGVAWAAFGLISILAKHNYSFGALQGGIGGVYVLIAVLERPAVSPKRRRAIRLMASLSLLIAGAAYLLLRR